MHLNDALLVIGLIFAVPSIALYIISGIRMEEHKQTKVLNRLLLSLAIGMSVVGFLLVISAPLVAVFMPNTGGPQ